MTVTRAVQRGFTLIEMMVVVALIGIFALIVFNIQSTTYGANPDNYGDQVASIVNMARMRSVSTRHPHLIIFNPSTAPVCASNTQQGCCPSGNKNGCIQVMAGDSFGMCNPCSPATVFTQFENAPVPNGITLWAATTNVQTNTGSNPAQNTGLTPSGFTLRFNADGSTSTTAGVAQGGTIYLTDSGVHTKKNRVLIYQLTGSSYARTAW